MTLSENLQDAFDQQIAMEFSSMYAYLQMAAYFDSLDYPGFSTWMRLQADEERTHAMKFYEFVLERGSDVALRTIEAPKSDFSSPLDAFETALRQEQAVTKSIHSIFDAATDEKDYASYTILQWFVEEQVEEEGTVGRIVERLRKADGDPTALLMLDRELGERSSSATG